MVHGQVTWTCTKGVPSWQPLLKRCVMSDEQEQDSSPLMPIEQQTILLYGKPLVVVRLPDRRPAIVLRHICDNLQLEPTSQVRRIKRTEAIADDLVYTQIQTDGGPQIMPTLVLRAAPFWLAGIDPKRVREEIRPEILRYQREVVDVLYAWTQSPKVTHPPATLVPAEQITKPVPPTDDAGLEVWREYHRQMVSDPTRESLILTHILPSDTIQDEHTRRVGPQ